MHERDVISPKGYLVGRGYMGYLPSLGKYILFPTETEYYEMLREEAPDEDTK